MAAVQSLSALLQQSSIDDHDEIIKACNATLKKSKNDLEAQHVKAVALLKQDRFDDAIRVFEEGGDVLKQRASLEWAYALYKIGKLEEAIEAAATSKRGRGARHVEAQAVRIPNHTREAILQTIRTNRWMFCTGISCGKISTDKSHLSTTL